MVVVGVVQRGEPRGYGLGAKRKSRLASMCEDSSLPPLDISIPYLLLCSWTKTILDLLVRPGQCQYLTIDNARHSLSLTTPLKD